MRTYRNTIKLFLQTTSVRIPYFLLLLVENVFLFQLLRSFINADKSQAQPFYYINDLNLLCIVEFLFFVFISYEFLRKGKDVNLEETLIAKTWVIEGTQLLVLWSAVFLYAVIFALYIGIAYFILKIPLLCVQELMKVFLVNVLLMALASVGMGYAISRIRNRLCGYVIILVSMLLLLPQTANFFVVIEKDYHVPVFPLRDWFYILPPDVNTFGDPLYGVPVEPYRIATMVAWIVIGLFCFALVRWRYHKGMKVLVTMVTGACLFVCGGMISERGSVLLMSDHLESAIETSSDEYSEDEKQANFNITEYDMELVFQRELEANVMAKIQSDEPLSEYIFTLYHGYEVTNVEDEKGCPLRYEQEEDRILVYGQKEKQLEQIVFHYKGNSPMFYANDNACFLPGFFPYYPQAGGRSIYSYEGATEINVQEQPVAQYRIRTQGLSVTSNIPTVDGTSSFEGKASHVTFVGGNYEVIKENGVEKVVYPLQEDSLLRATQFQQDEFQARWTALLKFLEIPEMPLPINKKVIVTPMNYAYNSFLGSYYEFDDYVFIGHSFDVYDVLKSKLPKAEKKNELKEVFFNMGLTEDTDIKELQLNTEMFPGEERGTRQIMEDGVIMACRKCGIQKTAQEIAHYLMDESDTRSPMKVLGQVRKENGDD